MAAPVAVTVSLSHDGSSFTDVSAYVSASRLEFQRGLSRVLGEWQPGTFNLPVLNFARAIDPTNDAATFQPRPGDHIKIALGGTTHFRGRVRQASVKYERAGAHPTSRLTLAGADAMSTLAKATVTDLVDSPVGYGIYYTGSLVDLVLTLADNVNFSTAKTIDAGDTVSALPDTGTFNALEVLQTCTRTEGGNSQLFTLKDGTLRWRSRYARPSQVVVFGGSGIPIRDADMDYTDDEWSNLVNLTPAQHVDPDQTASTSVTSGTGTKNFTLDALTSDGWGFSAGAAVYVESLGSPGNNMTGTVTSFNETTRALVCDIASKNGSSTRTDWVFTFTEPSVTQTATDAQSRTTFGEYITTEVATYHRNLVVAAAEATLLAASSAYPSRRISTVVVELARLSSAQRTSVLGLEIGDAIDASVALGTGTPSTLRQVRQIDGIGHQISGSGSHQVTFTLGAEVTVDVTAVVKQNGSTVAHDSATSTSRYSMSGDWVDVAMHFVLSASGTANTQIKVTPTGLPTPLVSGHRAHGTYYFDGSTDSAGLAYFDGTDIILYQDSATTPLGQTPNVTLTSSNTLSIQLSYPIGTTPSFTCTLKQSSTVASTTTSATYQVRDGKCRAQALLVATAAGSAGSTIEMIPTGLPVPATPTNQAHGWLTHVTAGGTRYTGSAGLSATPSISMASNNRGGLHGAAPSVAIGIGDTFSVYLEYPVA